MAEGRIHYVFDGADLTVIRPLDKYKQVYTIDSLGTADVSKHGHTIVRSTNDVIRLDGVIVHDGSN